MVMQHGVGTKNLLLHAAYSPRYIVLIPLRAPTKVGEHSGLVLTFGVKQAANAQTSLRQAKQCTALFCPHSLTIKSGQWIVERKARFFANRITICAKSKTAEPAMQVVVFSVLVM
jgi:hypothetical protein